MTSSDMVFSSSGHVVRGALFFMKQINERLYH